MGFMPYKRGSRDFTGGAVVKIFCSQCRRPVFDPWSGDSIPHATAKIQCSQINK